jgi:hypothetical protein
MSELLEEAATDFDTLSTRIPIFDGEDLRLLSQLGLKAPDLKPRVETSLGEVVLRHNVSIWVSAISMPALFFKFHFYFADSDKRHRAETGSGDFRTYWRMAKRFAKEKRDRKDPLFVITELSLV